GKSLLEPAYDIGGRALFVNALHDLGRAPRQLDQAYRIEQHERVLRRLPLEAVLPLERAHRIGSQPTLIHRASRCRRPGARDRLRRQSAWRPAWTTECRASIAEPRGHAAAARGS